MSSPIPTPAPPPKNRRGSPEAIEKRRAARLFNRVLLGEGGEGPDGRTERRRRRLLEELERGAARGGRRELKPIDVLLRVQELLSLGEALASIRKRCPRPRPVAPTKEVIEGLRLLHAAYAFAPEVYAFVGLDDAILRRAGILRGPSGPGLRAARSPERRQRGDAGPDRERAAAETPRLTRRAARG